MAAEATGEVRVDRTTPIEALLAGHDLCIGGASTATLQAALAGTPVVVLNVSGCAWPWPIGEDTAVPVAHGVEELATWLMRAARGERLPGHEDLVEALGARDGGAVSRLAEIVADTRRLR